nr:DnaJ domain-containing protein [Archangium violaceum]
MRLIEQRRLAEVSQLSDVARIAEAAELQDGELILGSAPAEVSTQPVSRSESSVSEVAPAPEAWFDAFPSESTRGPGDAELPAQEDASALRLAREQANAALMRDMQEAQRRAGSAPPESWLIDEPAQPIPPAVPAAPAPQESANEGSDLNFWADLSVPESQPPAPVVPAPVTPAPAMSPPAARPPPPAMPPPAARPPPAAPPRAAVPPGLRSPAASTQVPAAPVPPGLRSPAANTAAPSGPVPPNAGPVPPNLWARNSAPAAPSQPLRLGPDAPRPSGDEDLWRIVTFDNAAGEAPGDINASFEAALQQVDAHLESLVRAEVPQASAPTAPAPQPPAPPAPAAPVPTPAVTTASSVPTVDFDMPDSWDDLSLEENDLAEDVSDEEAKVRRQRLLQRAMEIGSRPAAAPPAPDAPAPGAPPPLSAEQQLAQEIEKRYADVQANRDHFTMLGLPIGPDVKREQVKTAFLGLAKRFHPDRLPPGLSSLAPRMTAVFESIRGAYEVLYDDAKRAAYLQELRSKASAQAAKPAGGVDSNDLFKMGEVFFRKRDFAGAADHFERAYNAEPKAVYLAARAWAIYMDPQRKADIPKAKQMMAEALKRDPNCDRAHYQLGVISRVEGDMVRAERHFREAVRANPKHLEANQELRLIEMRKKNPPPKKGGGIFG